MLKDQQPFGWAALEDLLLWDKNPRKNEMTPQCRPGCCRGRGVVRDHGYGDWEPHPAS